VVSLVSHSPAPVHEQPYVWLSLAPRPFWRRSFGLSKPSRNGFYTPDTAALLLNSRRIPGVVRHTGFIRQLLHDKRVPMGRRYLYAPLPTGRATLTGVSRIHHNSNVVRYRKELSRREMRSLFMMGAFPVMKVSPPIT